MTVETVRRPRTKRRTIPRRAGRTFANAAISVLPVSQNRDKRIVTTFWKKITFLIRSRNHARFRRKICVDSRVCTRRLDQYNTLCKRILVNQGRRRPGPPPRPAVIYPFHGRGDRRTGGAARQCMPSSRHRNAQRSADSSMTFAVGRPAPWPLLVSIRINTGAGPAWSACSAAANL